MRQRLRACPLCTGSQSAFCYARVSGWKIDIKSNEQLKEMGFAFDEYEDSEDAPEAGEVTEIEETQNN